jgi:hypothetical protein
MSEFGTSKRETEIYVNVSESSSTVEHYSHAKYMELSPHWEVASCLDFPTFDTVGESRQLTALYPEPVQSNPYHHLSTSRFNIVHLITSWYS